MSEASESGDRSRQGAWNRTLFVWMLIFEAGMGVVAWLFGVPLKPWHWDGEALVDGMLWTVPPLLALAMMWYSQIGPLRDFRGMIRTRVLPLFETLNPVQLIVLGLAAGFGEEMLFRGLLQQALIGFFDPFDANPPVAWLAIGLLSLGFGALHALSATYFFFAIAMSVYLGWLFLRTENLVVPIVVHGVYDAIALIWLCRAARASSD